MSNFVHLHVHTQHSLLDGLGTSEDYAVRAKQLKQPALAMTDHGNICGAPEFYHACRKQGVRPIIGEEFYFVPDSTYRPAKGEPRIELYHITMLARKERGYSVLSELSTESHRRFYNKPLVDRALLESLGEDARHLVVLSGCAGSLLSKALLNGDRYVAEEELLWWRETFPNYYIEMMHHDTDFDVKLNKRLLSLSRKYSLEYVITNDPHYVDAEDESHHDALLAIQTGSDIDDPERFSFDGTGYHLRSAKEIAQAFRPYGRQVWERGAANSINIAKMCAGKIKEWEVRTWHIPKFPGVDDPDKEMEKICKRELKKRGLMGNKEYVRRTKQELEVYKTAGLADFMLITMDCIKYAREEGIPVGPGRGSVCGTLVGYLMDLHRIDPIRYKLLFERFLNPARPRMPDIDTDFGSARRDEMFKYVQEKYGSDNVIHVAAYQRMKLKRAFQSLGKAHGIPFAERMRISKEIPDDDDGVEEVLPPEIVEGYPDLAEQLERLAGTLSGVSQHPAGVIIADPKDKIRELVPEMYIASSKRFVGQYNLEAAEEMGLLKEDFLSLRCLDTIKECVDMVKERRGIELNPDEWVPDEEEGDKEIYSMLAKGQTQGVFQMEGPVNQRGCKDVKPKEFEDLVSITSLYRTGPIKAGFPKQFLENRLKGRKNIDYLHPLLKPILEETWGVILYQEQVMQISEQMAGFTMEQVDDIKEAIKHKRSKLMEEMQPVFIKGCKREHGIPKPISMAIWKQIEGYSGYSYNRSHAVAYTMLTYQTARLLRFYSLEYISALMRTVPGNKQGKAKREGYLKLALSLGVKIRPPDINSSGPLVTPHKSKDIIRFGLTDLTGVGEAAYRKIEEGRPKGGYTSYEQVAEAVRNKGVVAALADGSALKSIGVDGDMDATEKLLGWTFRDNMKKYRKKHRYEVAFPNGDRSRCRLVGEIYKIDKGRTKNGKPYLTWKIRWSLSDSYDIRLWAETERLWDLNIGSVVMVSGEWEEKWMNLSIGEPSQVLVLKRK